MGFASISEVYITTSNVYRTSELYEEGIESSKNHHLYMILEVDRLFIEKYEQTKDKLELTMSNGVGVLIECVNSQFIDQQYIRINDKKYSITQILLEAGYRMQAKLLYIGQAMGKKQDRTSLDRLSSHDKLQRILSETIDSNRNSDILLLTFGVNETKFMNTFGPIEEAKNSIDDHSDFVNDVHFINIVEAKLINYFKPKYNLDFKKGIVPSKSHGSYEEYYTKKFNSMCIIMNELPNFIFQTDTIQEFDVKKEIISGSINGNTNFLDALFLNK